MYLHVDVCCQYYTHLHPVYLVSKQAMCVDNQTLESGYLFDFNKVGKPHVYNTFKILFLLILL